MIETDFYTLLTSPTTSGLYGTVNADESPVATVCSLSPGGIFPVYVPKGSTFPCLSYNFVGGSSYSTFNTPGYQKYRVEVNCWSEDYAGAVNLRAAVITALNGYSVANSDTPNSIQSIQLIQSTDDFEHDLLQFRCIVEFYLYTTFI
jgi:hypothetical protein